MADERILIILGGTYHDFAGFGAAWTPALRDADYVVESTYDLDELNRLEEENYDLVISYTSLGLHREGQNDTHQETLTEEQTRSLVAWVRAGGGLLAVHSGTVSGIPNDPLRELIGGVFERHPPQFNFMVYPMHGDHPITHEVEAFSVKDEFYIEAWDRSVDVHMVAFDRGVAHPMVWSKSEGKGRVAHIAMGHDRKVWDLPQYNRLMMQAVEWLLAE